MNEELILKFSELGLLLSVLGKEICFYVLVKSKTCASVTLKAFSYNCLIYKIFCVLGIWDKIVCCQDSFHIVKGKRKQPIKLYGNETLSPHIEPEKAKNRQAL